MTTDSELLEVTESMRLYSWFFICMWELIYKSNKTRTAHQQEADEDAIFSEKLYKRNSSFCVLF